MIPALCYGFDPDDTAPVPCRPCGESLTWHAVRQSVSPCVLPRGHQGEHEGRGRYTRDRVRWMDAGTEAGR